MEEALILAEGFYGTSDGKTAHGLVRYSSKYKIVGVIDSTLSGKDAGEVLDGKNRNIPIYSSLDEAIVNHPNVKFLIIGVATAGGKLPSGYKKIIKRAIERNLNIISGLHEFLSDDRELVKIAKENNVEIVDVRKIFSNLKVFYSGKIKEVKALKVVVLGTDSCIGKRTTAMMITEELNKRGVKSTFVGTGQTAWMQGAKYCIVLDSMISDFIPGGLEHEIYRAYTEEKPKVIVVPGQGSLLHPVFPGSLEILTLLKPEITILQHAPGRKHLDGFPEYPLPPIKKYLKLIELITDRKVFAITINGESLSNDEVNSFIRMYEQEFGIVTCAPLIEGVKRIVDRIIERYPHLKG